MVLGDVSRGVDRVVARAQRVVDLDAAPDDALKVPKPFLDGLGEGGQAATLVRGIIELGRTLGLTVVAEGVEQARQWECLEELSCDLVQGYYFARPQSAERIDALLRRHARPGVGRTRGAAAVNGSKPLVTPAAPPS